VEIDCRDLQYLSSAGLRVLMIIQKDLGKDAMVLLHVPDEIREILSVTGTKIPFRSDPERSW